MEDDKMLETDITSGR